MKKFMLILIFCGIIFGKNICAYPQTSGDLSRYFPLEVNNAWIYRSIEMMNKQNYSLSVASILETEVLDGKEIYLFEINLSKKPIFGYGKDNGEIYIYKLIEDDAYTLFTPPIPFLVNLDRPRSAKTYSSKGKLFNNNNELIEEYDVEAKVEFYGKENVSVFAGKFDNCLKFHLLTKFYKKSHPMTTDQFVWFAKDKGKVKENSVITIYNGQPREFHHQYELEKVILSSDI